MRGLAAIGYVTLDDEPAEAETKVAVQPPRNPVLPRPQTSLPTQSFRPVVPQMSPETEARIRQLDKDAEDRLVHVMANDGAPHVEEMMGTLETLVDTGLEERVQYTTALKLLSKKGVSAPLLLQDYATCLTALEANYKDFEAQSQKAVASKVGSKIQAVENLNKQLEAKTAQIAALQQEMTQIAAQRDQEQAGISEEEQKIELVKTRFNHVYTNIRSAIETQRDKIKTYGAGQ